MWLCSSCWLKCLCLSTNSFIICSVAAEPNLKEWTARTKVYDRCDETVSVRHLKYVLYKEKKKNNVCMDIDLSE